MVGERDPKFYSELKQMNEDLLSFLKVTHEKSPYFDFTPTVNDYVKQIGELDKQYPEKSSSITAITTTTASTTSSLMSTTTQSPVSSVSSLPKPTPFATSTFSVSATPFAPLVPSSMAPPSVQTSQAATTTISQQSAAPAMQPFLFGAATTNPSLAATPSSSFFSFGIPKKEDECISTTTTTINNTNNNDNNDAADDDAPPPEPKIDKYEEPDAKYSVKCKLYDKGKMTDGEVSVTLLGIGFLYVKALDAPNKLQVIFRQEPDLRRVLLNEVVTPNIPVKILPKAVQMVFPGQSGETKFYIAKLREEKDATTLFDMLNFTRT